jgi:glycosyltransferase involved in cell wall biosynthesis
MSKKLISIVTPCYNEALNVLEHFKQVNLAVESFKNEFDFEHIYTDNCSKDSTFGILSELADRNPNVKIMRFSSNIGANRAVFMGLKEAKGDAIVLIQADLQDPPSLIKEFIQEWIEGYDVVYGLIKGREESLILRTFRNVYYHMIDSLSDIDIPKSAGEFRLTSRRVLDALMQFHEDDLYIRGAIARIGFRQKSIPYYRLARAKGESSHNLLKLISYAINAFVSTSVAPIRMVSVCGVIFSGVGFLLTIIIVLFKIFVPESAPKGIATISCLVTFFAGVQLLSIGIIGEYIRKTYQQSLGRPLGFIEHSKNID